MAARVGDANRPPYNSVCLLRIALGGGAGGRGTGALIGSRWILTCAHNLSGQPGDLYRATGVTAFPAWNSRQAPAGGVAADYAFFPAVYRQGQDMWDVGVIHLNADAPPPPPPNRRFYFVPQPMDARIIGEDVDLTGYPGGHGGEMWTDRDEVNGVHLPTNTMLFTNDTDAGSSGSPVYRYDAEADRVFQWGVHNSVNPQYGLRRGLLITRVVYDWIRFAIAQPAGQYFATGI